MLVDSHAHLEAVDDLEGSLKRAKEAGVGKIITIGTSLASSRKAIEIADKFSAGDLQIYATCGLHPRDAKGEIDNLGMFHCFETLKQIAKSSSKVVGVGEVGLDYRLTTDNEQLTTDEEKGFQRELFKAQINLAADLNLPLIIHCRNGWDEIFELLKTTINYSSSETKGRIEKSFDPELKTEGFSTSSNSKVPSLWGVFHSFTGIWQDAKKALGLGFYISFSGIVTFKNAKEIQEVGKKMPIERMMIETDSPFLSPEPIRNGPPKLTSHLSSTIRTRLEERNRRVYKQNEPKNVRIIAEFLAHLRSQPIDKIIGASAENAKKLFGI